MRCTICGHEARREMEQAVVGGVPVKHVAARYGLSYAALRRHLRAHLPQAVVEAGEASDRAQGSALLAQARHFREQAGEILVGARARGDDRTALHAIREGARCVELEAKLTGEWVERQAVEVRERSLHRPPIQLTREEHAALAPVARRLLLGNAPGYVDDAEWYAVEEPAEGVGEEIPRP